MKLSIRREALAGDIIEPLQGGGALIRRGMKSQKFLEAAAELVEAGRRFDGRGWVLGTSGNLSVVVAPQPLTLAITPSGAFKGSLTESRILEVDEQGVVSGDTSVRPSAETGLHLAIVRARGAGAVFHTHSIWSTVLSDLHTTEGGLLIEGYEMLKGLSGVRTHQHSEWVPIVENDQDMSRLGRVVSDALAQHPGAHGFLIRRHGLYTWGEDAEEAIRHVEIFEFLFETIGQTLACRRAAGRAALET
ncbi:MAG TPA: methylthioribulose 1-phosphate dehydratase [Vicinamibacterales bacterium]|jgi:methylthioribulose-1-phosphate dehydratase|nr:methylthioribulose 1-phosphate dehydratase [Vicinamibacterales bacterium]